MTAAEVAAALRERQSAAPGAEASRERRERERAEHARLLDEGQAEILADLRAIGIDVPSLWHLAAGDGASGAVFEVLLRHLGGAHPDLIVEGLGDAMAGPQARPYWAELRALLASTERDVVRDQTVLILGSCAQRAQYDDLLEMVADEGLGDSRIFLLGPLNRIGNRIEAGRGRAVVGRFANHPELGVEAARILAGRGRRG
ncbi:hypothetical protein [Nocardioides sp.]|uniref:hypothetical protein n=1 Tax=Nocardioides sp. TaxID=35761 RepID=UPI00262D35C1|nr:hypothetical protein [Nocardioides sp.]